MAPGASARPPDSGKATGMTVLYAGLDLEQAVGELAEAGFEAAEVFVGHLGPRVVEAPVFEAHAEAAGALVRQGGLAVSTLNSIVGQFDPFSSEETFERTAESLARHLRLGAATGSPRCSFGTVSSIGRELLAEAPACLARDRAGPGPERSINPLTWRSNCTRTLLPSSTGFTRPSHKRWKRSVPASASTFVMPPSPWDRLLRPS